MGREGKIFYGWWIVVATFIVLFAGLCSGFYTVSVFLEPLQAAFGWTKTQVSLGFTIAALLVGLLSPVVGIAVAKLGIKKVQLTGALLTGTGLLLLSTIQHLWQYYAVFIYLAVGLASVGLVPSQTTISYWFVKKRGLAMGIIMTGVGVGGMAMVFIASQVVAAMDWRWAYRVLGLIVLGLVVPAILLIIKDRPQDMGLVPDGESAASGAAQSAASGVNFTVGQAFGTLAFFLTCLIMALYSVILGGMTQHAIAMLGSLSVAGAGLFWSLTLGASVIGRVVFGGLADRVSKKLLLLVIWVFHIIGLGTVFYLAANGALVWAFVLFYGIALGSFPTLFPLFLGEKFGIEHFSKLVGIAGLFQILGLAIGSVLLGKIYDASGSYAGGIKLLLIIAAVALAITAFIGTPKLKEKKAA
jgi:MFS family permease